MAGTTFSNHLGQKHYKKSKKSKIHADLGFETFRQFLKESLGKMTENVVSAMIYLVSEETRF